MTTATDTIGSRFRRPLTDDELARIDRALRSAPGADGPAKAIIAVWDIILGEAEGTTYAVAMAGNQGLRPNDYAIPKAQAKEIIASFKKGRRVSVGRSAAFSWISSGPASYVESTPAG